MWDRERIGGDGGIIVDMERHGLRRNGADPKEWVIRLGRKKKGNLTGCKALADKFPIISLNQSVIFLKEVVQGVKEIRRGLSRRS